MKRAFAAAMTAIMISTLPVVAIGADGNWKMPNLNPFASKAASTNTPAGNPPTSGWHAPNLWPKTAAAAKRRPSAPTTWNKMTSGTRNFFSKTADALNPWDNKQPKQPQKVTGSSTAFTHNKSSKQEPTSGSILPAAWWSSDKSDKKDSAGGPKTVNEFLSQQRPH